MANIFEFLSKDGNINPNKAQKSRQMQFYDKTAYVWGLRYRWDPSLLMNPVRRFGHIYRTSINGYFLDHWQNHGYQKVEFGNYRYLLHWNWSHKYNIAILYFQSLFAPLWCCFKPFKRFLNLFHAILSLSDLILRCFSAKSETCENSDKNVHKVDKLDFFLNNQYRI